MAVGGSFVGFNNINVDDDNDDNDQSTFSIAPNIGYFIMDNLELDLGLAYQSRTVEDARSSAYAFAPAVRYHIPAASLAKKNMFPYVGAGFAYTSRTKENAGPMGDDLEVSGTDITLGAGITQALGGSQGAIVSLGLEYHMGSLQS